MPLAQSVVATSNRQDSPHHDCIYRKSTRCLHIDSGYYITCFDVLITSVCNPLHYHLYLPLIIRIHYRGIKVVKEMLYMENSSRSHRL